MILVGNQRGGAKNLALHLLKEENDHVAVHELRGFASDNLVGALNESYAISRGTRCKQFLYSLSINPPPNEQVGTAEFEDAINRVEVQLGLIGQPRAIVFHEKAGADGLPRRHAHAVWSRILADEMKAVHISHDRHKLTDLSRELYLEHGFKMPRGLMKSSERDPRNFSLEDWQKAKRSEKDPREVKAALQDCWAVSDSRASFEHALQSRGFKLARGDRRNFVAVDMKGNPFAVAKCVGIRTKAVRERLGELKDDFPSVEDRKQEFASEIAQRLGELRGVEERKAAQERERTERERKELVERQRIDRAEQQAALQARWERETAERQERFNHGWRKLLDHFTGRQQRVREQNIAERYEAVLRDRAEKDVLIFRQLEERRSLLERGRQMQCEIEARKVGLDADISRQSEFARAAKPVPAPQLQPRHAASRSPPNPAPHVQAAPEIPTAKAEFDKASQQGSVVDDRAVRREAFLQQRQEQATQPTQDRGRQHRLER